MQSAQAPLEGRASGPANDRRIRRNARIDTQRLSRIRRQDDHDDRHGAHHRQLRHLGAWATCCAASAHPRSRLLEAQKSRPRTITSPTIERSSNISGGSGAPSPTRKHARSASIAASCSNLLNEAAVDEEARKLGLGISDEALREVITSNPSFHDKSGAFDPALLANALRNMDMNERGFVSELRQQVLRQFIVGALATGITAPKAEVTAEADYQGQTRSADYFLLPASAAGDIPAPSEDAPENLLQRSQVELSCARIPGDDHSWRSSRTRSPMQPK